MTEQNAVRMARAEQAAGFRWPGLAHSEREAIEQARAAVRRCAYCGHLGDLEPVSPNTSSQACKNTQSCQLRVLGWQPPELLIAVAQAVAGDVSQLSEIELARVILSLKAAVIAAEVELGSHRDRAHGDAVLAQAAEELRPRAQG